MRAVHLNLTVIADSGAHDDAPMIRFSRANNNVGHKQKRTAPKPCVFVQPIHRHIQGSLRKYPSLLGSRMRKETISEIAHITVTYQ
jgi:hypothetical protein